MTAIAADLGRSMSTFSREVARNGRDIHDIQDGRRGNAHFVSLELARACGGS